MDQELVLEALHGHGKVNDGDFRGELRREVRVREARRHVQLEPAQVFWVLGFGWRVLGLGVLGFGFWVLGFGVWGLGFGV